MKSPDPIAEPRLIKYASECLRQMGEVYPFCIKISTYPIRLGREAAILALKPESKQDSGVGQTCRPGAAIRCWLINWRNIDNAIDSWQPKCLISY